MALVPIRIRGRLHGMIACGWRDTAAIGPHAVLEERVAGIADQAATAIENATLLEQVRHQALHDALTGLPNQTLFADRVTSAISRARRNGTRVGVSVLDLDRFKTVNDSLGHGAGDQLLVAGRPSGCAAPCARPTPIARMGGDEFTLLLPDLGRGRRGHSRRAHPRRLRAALRGRGPPSPHQPEHRHRRLPRRRRRLRAAAPRAPTSPCTAPRSGAGTPGRATRAAWPSAPTTG